MNLFLQGFLHGDLPRQALLEAGALLSEGAATARLSCCMHTDSGGRCKLIKMVPAGGSDYPLASFGPAAYTAPDWTPTYETKSEQPMSVRRNLSTSTHAKHNAWAAVAVPAAATTLASSRRA